MSYRSRSAELDGEILRVVHAWQRDGRGLTDAEFDDLALREFAYQIEWNAPYARYCASLGVSPSAPPRTWRDIPPVPTGAFKDATLATFDPADAALAFETSGTTSGLGGRHYMDTRALYDASLFASFDRYLLADGARLRYLNLVPNPADRPQSSLGYMMGRISAERGDGATGWYLRGDDLFVDALLADANAAIADGVAVCLAGTAFAFVQVCDEFERRGATLALPQGSRVMETGGFKGRSRIVGREALYAAIAARFGVPQHCIVAEYSMTELSSQWYGVEPGKPMRGPAWLRARAIGPDGATLPEGVVGALVHVDLANRGSCIAVQTEDLGAVFGDGIVLIGREAGAELRGCSLDAESLRPR